MRLSTDGTGRPGRPRPARRRRTFAVLGGGLLPLLIVTGCNPLAAHPALPQITVAAVPGIENANLYLAEHDGAFTKAGISVRIDRYASVTSAINALSNGTVDVISADYGDMFYVASSQAHPIFRLLADGYDAASGVIEIVTMPNSSIKTPGDLAGQTIPVPNTEEVPHEATGDPDTLALASAISVLQSDGVNLADVQWQPTSQSQEISELVDHRVGAILVSGLGVYQAQQEGAVELIDACSGPTSGIPLDGFFTSSAWLSENSDSTAAQDFAKAIYAVDATAAMPGPIQAILPAWIGQHMTPQEADLVTTGSYPLSTITANLQRTAALMDNEGMTANEVNVAAMLGP
jgi:NitT/TauT family transport system substrate-binding protein